MIRQIRRRAGGLATAQDLNGSHVTAVRSYVTAVRSHVTAVRSYVTVVRSHVTAVWSHGNVIRSHVIVVRCREVATGGGGACREYIVGGCSPV